MTSIKLKLQNSCATSSSCDPCTLREICRRPDAVASGNRQPVECHCRILGSDAGAHIYWIGEPLDRVYAVKSGCIKTYTLDKDGNERVRGFHLPGDILGLDAIGSGHYPSNAAAVSDASMCSLPYSELERALASPTFTGPFITLMAMHLSTALAMAGDYTAEQRLAAFLVSLHKRERTQNMTQGKKLKLPMKRRDIASLLRLAPETISRLLSQFSKQGLLVTSSISELDLLDLPQLQQLAEPVGITTGYKSSLRAA